MRNLAITRPAILRAIALLAWVGITAFGNSSSVWSQTLDTPMTRLRPIGAPSAVDQYRRDSVRETSYTSYGPVSDVRQAAMQIEVPPSMPSASPLGSPPPATATPRSLPQAPVSSFPQGPAVVSSSSDMSPISPPQLSSGGFATINNCSNISGPSRYSAASGIGCGQPLYQTPVTYGPAVGTSVAPPMVAAPIAIAPPSAAPIGPLISFGQTLNPVQVGPGLFGQPKAYVPGQGLRNWLRYFTP